MDSLHPWQRIQGIRSRQGTVMTIASSPMFQKRRRQVMLPYYQLFLKRSWRVSFHHFWAFTKVITFILFNLQKYKFRTQVILCWMFLLNSYLILYVKLLFNMTELINYLISSQIHIYSLFKFSNHLTFIHILTEVWYFW